MFIVKSLVQTGVDHVALNLNLPEFVRDLKFLFRQELYCGDNGCKLTRTDGLGVV